MRRERKFRTNKVITFLKTLKNTFSEPIQQRAIGGSPDYLLCARGKFVALELKDVDGEPSKLQEYKLSEIVRCGGISIVTDQANWEATKKLLSKLDRGGS